MLKNIYIIFYLPLFLLACARIGAPTGGKKDTTPPVLDTLASTANYQTNFRENKIVLVFDEYLQLKDPATQIFISPPLNKRPEITLAGKMVSFAFPKGETLRSNTTYTINFGGAVVDFHEGNAAADLRFVFSTGNRIDSLGLAGSVTDAFSGEPVKEIRVLVYDNLTDSAIVLEKPYYVSRTDDQGQFRLQNLRPGTYRLVAVEDTDQNMRWSGRGERLAFLDSLVTLDSAHQPRNLQLRLFTAQGDGQIATTRAERYGLLELIYAGDPPANLELRPTTDEVRLFTQHSGDTIRVYYEQTTAAPWRLITGPADTISVRNYAKSEFLQTYRLRFADQAPSGMASKQRGRGVNAGNTVPPLPAPRTVQQPADKPADLFFTAPIVAVDTVQWQVQEDTLPLRNFTVTPDTAQKTRLALSINWQKEKIYNITLLPGAVTDIYGVTNTDTLKRIFTIPGDRQYGNINLILHGLLPGQAYVAELVSNNAVVQTQRFQADSTDVRRPFTRLNPGNYTLRLIEDRNANGQWDEGNYWLGLQPEPVYRRTVEGVRANWELEVEFTPGESEKGQKTRG